MISEESLLEFSGALFKSVWALELLLALKRRSDRAWLTSEIIRELRGSQVVAAEALNNLIGAGLVTQDDNGRYRYQPGSLAVDVMIAELEKLYALKPTSVIYKIVTSPSLKLQILSDAFRIKE
jgi:predicted transcriptional regulator